MIYKNKKIEKRKANFSTLSEVTSEKHLQLPKIDVRPEQYPKNINIPVEKSTSLNPSSLGIYSRMSDSNMDKLNEKKRLEDELTKNTRDFIRNLREKDQQTYEMCVEKTLIDPRIWTEDNTTLIKRNYKKGLLVPKDIDENEIKDQLKANIEYKNFLKKLKQKEKLLAERKNRKEKLRESYLH
jgi:hypothetical protein